MRNMLCLKVLMKLEFVHLFVKNKIYWLNIKFMVGFGYGTKGSLSISIKSNQPKWGLKLDFIPTY